MDPHANLLVNTLSLWWLGGEVPVGRVDVKAMALEECLCTFGGGDWLRLWRDGPVLARLPLFGDRLQGFSNCWLRFRGLWFLGGGGGRGNDLRNGAHRLGALPATEGARQAIEYLVVLLLLVLPSQRC